MPPAARTPAWRSMTEAAARAQFILPTCTTCGVVQYPVREICRHCLSG
ncbi:MAG: zinc ribbon domain-containing protein, partial [Longimicrobiales bacterium]